MFVLFMRNKSLFIITLLLHCVSLLLRQSSGSLYKERQIFAIGAILYFVHCRHFFISSKFVTPAISTILAISFISNFWKLKLFWLLQPFHSPFRPTDQQTFIPWCFYSLLKRRTVKYCWCIVILMGGGKERGLEIAISAISNVVTVFNFAALDSRTRDLFFTK